MASVGGCRTAVPSVGYHRNWQDLKFPPAGLIQERASHLRFTNDQLCLDLNTTQVSTEPAALYLPRMAQACRTINLLSSAGFRGRLGGSTWRAATISPRSTSLFSIAKDLRRIPWELPLSLQSPVWLRWSNFLFHLRLSTVWTVAMRSAQVNGGDTHCGWSSVNTSDRRFHIFRKRQHASKVPERDL